MMHNCLRNFSPRAHPWLKLWGLQNLKSVGLGAIAGVAQMVEHQPSKLRAAGSKPVSRFFASGG